MAGLAADAGPYGTGSGTRVPRMAAARGVIRVRENAVARTANRGR